MLVLAVWKMIGEGMTDGDKEAIAVVRERQRGGLD